MKYTSPKETALQNQVDHKMNEVFNIQSRSSIHSAKSPFCFPCNPKTVQFQFSSQLRKEMGFTADPRETNQITALK